MWRGSGGLWWLRGDKETIETAVETSELMSHSHDELSSSVKRE